MESTLISKEGLTTKHSVIILNIYARGCKRNCHHTKTAQYYRGSLLTNLLSFLNSPAKLLLVLDNHCNLFRRVYKKCRNPADYIQRRYEYVLRGRD